MNKLTKKQIDAIIANTPKELKGKQLSFYADFGYFTKAGANWSYWAGWVDYKGIKILAVTVFGEVK